MAGAIKSVIIISGGTDADRKTIEQAAEETARRIKNLKPRKEVGQVTVTILS